ncbi:MAG: hypothetical protein JKP95_02145 [Oceanicaulis sp.]|nr:hypothetical protein [Oceanicaulis sp.]
MFERFMFAPETGAVLERFGPDWTRIRDDRIEPGHCYEWIYLLSETDRLVGAIAAAGCAAFTLSQKAMASVTAWR